MNLLSKPRMPLKLVRLYILQRKGIVAGVLAAVFGGGYLVYDKSPLEEALNIKFFQNTKSQTEEQPSYIYLPPGKQDTAPLFGDEKKSKSWIPWKREEKYLHWKLLKLAQSKDRNVRHMAVRALADVPNLNDSEYREIAQACDQRTAVGLARTLGADLRFFLTPPYQHKDVNNLETEFRLLLSSLPQSDVSHCVQYFTKNAIQSGYPLNFEDNGGEWCFGGEGLADDSVEQRPRRVPAETVEKFCLQALLRHSTVPSHRSIMVEKGVLQLLHRVLQNRKDNIETQSLICQILANLSLEEKMHRLLFMSGWLGILASWVRSPSVQLCLPANKALANMDRDYSFVPLFEDGIYPLYPQFRGRERKIHADVIFVHGLLGGAFKTWRQHDSKKPAPEVTSKTLDQVVDSKQKNVRNTIDEDHHNFHATLGVVHGLHPDGYTYCWPKDWLAYECPHLRLVAVDYDTYVSEWRAKCPVEKNKHTFQVRGDETLMKLIASGIGERPIIWVAHSMGGILVKQMLVEASASDNPRIKSIAEKTTGVVFYSVPHKGTELAKFRPSLEILLQPSVEVQQLKRDSPQLLKLHKDFEEFVKRQHIACMSFGETEKSKLGLNWSSVLVTPDSADPGFGDFYKLPLDHLNTCKPETHDSPIYRLLVEFLLKYASHSLIENLVGPTPSAEDMETSLVFGVVHNHGMKLMETKAHASNKF